MLLKSIIHTSNEMISTFFSVFLFIAFPTILSVLASIMAIVWWFIKFYDKYNKK